MGCESKLELTFIPFHLFFLGSATPNDGGMIDDFSSFDSTQGEEECKKENQIYALILPLFGFCILAIFTYMDDILTS